MICSPKADPADIRVILAQTGRRTFREARPPLAQQIIRKLREAAADLANCVSVADTCKKLDVAGNTYYRWRNQYGGIKADEMRRLQELEKENARLKTLVANLRLDKVVL